MLRRPSFFKHIFSPKEEIILRDYLALERTKLANERTLLAYSRTSVYMLLGGIAFLQLKDFMAIRWIGYVTIGLSVILAVFGLFRFLQIRIHLDRYYQKTYNADTDNELT